MKDARVSGTLSVILLCLVQLRTNLMLTAQRLLSQTDALLSARVQICLLPLMLLRLFRMQAFSLRPAKAANAGGVATSALEMSQNSMRYSWTFEEVDAKLKNIMEDIYAKTSGAAKEYGHEGNLVIGANIAGFKKVADSMMAHGII